MHRTQILLEEYQYRYLQFRVKQEGKSVSAFLGEILDKHMHAQPDNEDPLWDIVGMSEGDPEAIAREHDKYLYGYKLC